MRVAHLLPLFDPRTKGGMEIFCTSLAKAQAAQGAEVHILCPNFREEAVREDFDGIPVLRFPFPYEHRDRAFILGTVRHPTCDTFRDAVEGINPDVIHLHGLYPFMLPYLAGIQLAARRKMVLTVHLVNVVCPRQTLVNYRGAFCEGWVDFETCANCVGSGSGVGKLKSVVSQMLLPLSSALVKWRRGTGLLRLVPAHGRVEAQVRTLDFMKAHCFMDLLNPWFRDVLLRNGFPESRVSYFRNPNMDCDSYVGSARAKPSNGRLRLLYVGRLSKEKGTDTLLKAVERLDRSRDRLSLCLVGRCVDQDIAASIASLVGRGHDIRMVGEVANDAVGSHYGESDVLVFPGSVDMMPLVIQEALENDLPVIASDRPSSRALVQEGLNGYLFKAGDVSDLTRVLRNLVETEGLLEFEYRPKADGHASKIDYYRQLYERVMGGPSEVR